MEEILFVQSVIANEQMPEGHTLTGWKRRIDVYEEKREAKRNQ